MSENLKEILLAKRRNRANKNNNQDNQDSESKLQQDAGITNDAFVDDNDQTLSDSIANKHRDKNREYAKKIKEDDPNKVSEELSSVKDRIRDRLKKNLSENLNKVKEEVEENKNDLKLDLISSARDDPNLGASRLSSTGTDLGTGTSYQQRLQKLKQSANYRLIGGSARRETRFDQEDKSDDDEDTKKLERLKEAVAKRKFKKAGQTVIDEIHAPSKEEQLDFFTKSNWQAEEEEESKKQADESLSSKTTDKADQPEATENTVLLMNAMDDWRDLNYNKAKYIPHKVIKEHNEKTLFMPSPKNIPLKRKLGESAEKPRILEEEGYYVGTKPYITIKNRNLMEDRLLRLSDNRGLKWFGVDGQIIALPDPIKYVSTRPSFNFSYSDSLSVKYRKALYLEDFSKNLIAEKSGSLTTKNAARYRIDLDVNQAQFSYHHLFSNEHILAFSLQRMYNHFKLMEEQNLIELLTAKLKALKEARARFMIDMESNTNKNASSRGRYVESTGEIVKTNVENKDTAAYISAVDANKLMAYTNEIKLTREQRDIQMKQRKTLTEKIIRTWKDLKEIRNQQQFRNTEIKLIIKKKDVNMTKEKSQYEKDLKEEFEEIVAEKKDEYQKLSAEYTKEHKAWKFQQTKKAEAKRRQDQRENRDPNEPPETNITKIAKEREQQEMDLKILKEEDLPEPVKPEPVDESKIYEDLRNHYEDTRKAPGEPIISFDLTKEGAVTPSNQCPKKEQVRRNNLAHTRVYIKILLNNKVVHTTKESPLESDFLVRWGQIFNIYMINHPDSICLQLYEYTDSRSHEHLVSSINLPAPERNCSSNNYSLDDYEFSSSQPFNMYSKTTNQIESFYTSGIIKAGAGWGIDEKDGTILVPPLSSSQSESALKQDEMKNFDAIAALGVSRMQDMEKLAKWVQKSNLDPNDPRNSDLMNLIRSITESDGIGSNLSGLKIPTYFRLDQLMEEFNFATDEDIEKNQRYKLIILRAQNEPEFKDYKMIPAIDRYVKKDMFDQYEKRKLKDITEEDEEKPDDTMKSTSRYKEIDDEIEISRAQGQKLVKKIRERIIKQFQFTQTQKTLSDMVIEEQVPNINALGSLFYNLYVEPRRPLYPNRRERKKVKGQNISPDDVYILVNIVNAYDLPVRKEKLSNDPYQVFQDPITGKSMKVHEHIAGQSLVQPFVEVSFQQAIYKTSTADGPNASWNQEIHLPFKAPNNDLRPESLQTCKDNIYINVFDEVKVDVLEDERDRGSTIHKRIQRYWLGSLKIPFSTVYFKSKIEGTFKLETPSVMLGYTRDPKLSHLNTYASSEAIINMDNRARDSSYLSMYVTIEPQLLVPEAFRETYDSIESAELIAKVLKWLADFRKQNPNREFRPLVMNTDGKSVLITRYFRAIKPPEELIEDGETSVQSTENVARFVNLIPFVADSLIFPGLCDIWSRCDQFLEMLSGDEEEHSVLLVNLFLGLGKKTWLLVGSSITNGLCCYALTQESDGFTIWYQGNPYKVDEPHSPIKMVSAIINSENMWLNVQPFDEPYRIKFDFNNTKLWRPFFDKNTANNFESIQPERLIYTKTDPKYIQKLASSIELKVWDQLRAWRDLKLTKKNSDLCVALREILVNMEKNRKKLLDNNEPDQLKPLMSIYRISGYPINIPYTNIKQVIEAVYATQVHALPTNDVEFGVAVHIHPYPNTIMSVWIYIASLIKR